MQIPVSLNIYKHYCYQRPAPSSCVDMFLTALLLLKRPANWLKMALKNLKAVLHFVRDFFSGGHLSGSISNEKAKYLLMANVFLKWEAKRSIYDYSCFTSVLLVYHQHKG